MQIEASLVCWWTFFCHPVCPEAPLIVWWLSSWRWCFPSMFAHFFASVCMAFVLVTTWFSLYKTPKELSGGLWFGIHTWFNSVLCLQALYSRRLVCWCLYAPHNTPLGGFGLDVLTWRGLLRWGGPCLVALLMSCRGESAAALMVLGSFCLVVGIDIVGRVYILQTGLVSVNRVRATLLGSCISSVVEGRMYMLHRRLVSAELARVVVMQGV